MAINEYKTIECKLDGKKSVSIPINIKKNGVHVVEPLNIIVRGFLKFEAGLMGATFDFSLNELEDKTVVYPVLFSTDTIRVDNGRCVVVLLPRSEDLFEETMTVQERSEAVSDDSISSQGGIVPDEQIVDPTKEPVVIKIETGVIRTPYKISLEVTATSVEDVSIYSKTIDRGVNPTIEEETGVKSLFQKETKRDPSNIIVDCSSDLEWIPSVDSILGGNRGSKEEVLSEINNLKNSTPLGTSTMYDAVISGARILSNTSVDSDRKTIYLFTDNESNISIASLNNAITEVNNIDGDKQVPVLAGNMAVSDNPTLSVKANRSDTKNINKLSFLTGGQSVTVTDEDFIDDIVGIFYREAVGSIGYGTYEFVKDFGEEVSINNIVASFDIPTSDSNATWEIETSLDNYNFTAIDIVHNYTDSVDFENLLVRYIRFKIVLITGISSSFTDEYGTTPETPSLTSIQITFNANKVAYLYINKEEADSQPYHITLAVDANEINDDQIEVGVAKSDAHNWTDFSTESQPTVNQNGKIVIPIRFSQDISKFEQEPLKKVDIFSTKTEYGRWDYFATVIIYDKSDNVIPTDFYKTNPRDGRVIFNNALPSDYQDGDYKIGIINSGDYKIGLKLTNKTETDTLDIYGVGYEYSTSRDLLPPISKTAPEVQQVVIVNEFPNRFSIIEASYVYFDANFEPEDKTKREILWFINGEPKSFLENKIKWNDITDPNDPVYKNTSLTYPTSEELGTDTIEEWSKKQTSSLIKSEDNIYFEIKVSDGDLLSNKGKAASVNVLESTPIVSSLTIMARDSSGNIISRLATDTDAVIYPSLDESFFTDGEDVNKSEIIWTVNGEIFKRGVFGDPVLEGQSPYHEIRVNEIGTGNSIDYGLNISNAIIVQVIPQTGNSVGDPVISLPVVVQNALPRVFDLEYIGSAYTPNNDIILSWSFFDFDIVARGDVDNTAQFDQSNIKWYRKNLLDSDFTLVYSFNDIDLEFRELFNEESYRGNISTNLGFLTSTISKNILVVGQEWYAIITPYDSLDSGVSVTSRTITITSAMN